MLLSFARCVFLERTASSNLPLEMRVRSVVQVWGCRCIVEELVYLGLNRLAVSYEEHIPLPEGLLHVRVILWIDMGLSCSWAGLPRATGYSPSCTPFVRPEMWLLILQVLQKQSCFGPFGCALAISFYLDQFVSTFCVTTTSTMTRTLHMRLVKVLKILLVSPKLRNQTRFLLSFFKIDFK